MRVRVWLATLSAVAAFAAGVPSASAHDLGTRQTPRPSAGEQPRYDSQTTIDPFMRAVLIAMAARILREAAASPDPAAALGESLERALVAAMASPDTLRILEAMTGQALQEVPYELRQAMVAFATSMLAQMRRDLAQNRRQSP